MTPRISRLADHVWTASLVTFDAALRAAAGTGVLHVGRARLSETQPARTSTTVTWPNYKGASAFLAKLRAEAATPR